MINNQKVTQTKQRLELLTEIEQLSEEYIPSLLSFVRLFRQNLLTKEPSSKAWDSAIDRISNSGHNPEEIKKLFDLWSEVDDESEQKQTLKIIESMQKSSI